MKCWDWLHLFTAQVNAWISLIGQYFGVLLSKKQHENTALQVGSNTPLADANTHHTPLSTCVIFPSNSTACHAIHLRILLFTILFIFEMRLEQCYCELNNITPNLIKPTKCMMFHHRYIITPTINQSSPQDQKTHSTADFSSCFSLDKL